MDSMVEHFNGWEMSKNWTQILNKNFCRCENNMHERFRKTIAKEQFGSFHFGRWLKWPVIG